MAVNSRLILGLSVRFHLIKAIGVAVSFDDIPFGVTTVSLQLCIWPGSLGIQVVWLVLETDVSSL